jgi:hypothetical protein
MVKSKLSKRSFYTLLAFALILTVGVGVYAYGNYLAGNPAVLGHSSDEINITLPNGTIETLQKAYGAVVIKDSDGNITVNDVFMESNGSYLSAYLDKVNKSVTNTIAMTCTWTGWPTPPNNCTCTGAVTINCNNNPAPLTKYTCSCIDSIGAMAYCDKGGSTRELGKITQMKKYAYQTGCGSVVDNCPNQPYGCYIEPI